MARPKLNPIAIIENKKEALVLALNAHSPPDVVHDEVLSSSFLEFFRRASKQDLKTFQKHFSSLIDAPSSSAITQPSYTTLDIDIPIRPAQQSILGATSVWPSVGPPLSQHLTSPLSAREYFEPRASGGRLIRLVRAAQSFTTPNKLCSELIRLTRAPQGLKALKDPFLEGLLEIWSAAEGPFASHNESICRIQRLYQGRNKIKHRIPQYGIADHIAHLFLAHEVEELKRLDHTLLQGQGRLSAAFSIIAGNVGVQVGDVRQEYKYCKNYKHLLKKGGSGSFLLLGDKVTTLWERTLTVEDIDLILEFRKEFYPEIEAACHQLGDIARPLIVSGLLAYGWTSEELQSSDLIQTLENETMESFSSLVLGGCSRTKRLITFPGDKAHNVSVGMINPQVSSDPLNLIAAQDSPNETVQNNVILGATEGFPASNLLELRVPAITNSTNGMENFYENASCQGPPIRGQISTFGSGEGTHIGPIGLDGNAHEVHFPRNANVHNLFDIVYDNDWLPFATYISQPWNLGDIVQEQEQFE